MPARRRRALSLVLAACAGALLGCGSGSSSGTVATVPSAASQSTAAASTPPPTATSTQPTASTTAPTTTRSAPAPEFTQREAKPEGLGAASALVRAKGFTPVDPAEYHPGQALRVLIGTRAGAQGGSSQQAFFFVPGRYLGTDSSEPSGALKIVSQGDTEVTLAYGLYRAGDPGCCARGGQATVRFQLNNGKLAALDPIPPAGPAGGAGRR